MFGDQPEYMIFGTVWKDGAILSFFSVGYTDWAILAPLLYGYNACFHPHCFVLLKEEFICSRKVNKKTFGYQGLIVPSSSTLNTICSVSKHDQGRCFWLWAGTGAWCGHFMSLFWLKICLTQAFAFHHLGKVTSSYEIMKSSSFVSVLYFFRKLYWTDWGDRPAIEVAYMDGSNRKALVTTSTFYTQSSPAWHCLYFSTTFNC